MVIILKKIKNSLKNLIKGGNPIFIIQLKNHHIPNIGKSKIEPAKENILREKNR